MFARKKVDLIDSPRSDALRKQIDGAVKTFKQKTAAEKDVHLIEGATAGDRIVVSLDDEAREIFQKISTGVPSLRGIAWLNPDTRANQSREWLEEGAPKEGRLLLTSTTPTREDQ